MNSDNLLFVAGVVLVVGITVRTGYRWSRLDHNPWENSKVLGGSYSGFTPGWYPANMTVEQINARGRELMWTTPPAAIALCAFLLTRN